MGADGDPEAAMAEKGNEQQLGDFIKGRLLFLEDYCRQKGLDHPATLEAVKKEALKLAGSPERAQFLQERFLSGVVLSSSMIPYWVDRVFLQAMTTVLKGAGAPLSTHSSRVPTLTFEAGRFNAHRQAETVFKLLFSGKRPEEWLKGAFVAINKRCYGDEFASKFQVEEAGPGRVRITIDNSGMEKTHPMDCSTEIGYLFGALEKLGARDPVVTHDQCGAVPGAIDKRCVFDVTWK
jgi:hypothetical protein